jgi:MFS family permease
VLLISLFGAAITSLPQALITQYWQFLVLRFAAGMFLGGLLPTAHALIARLVRAEERGAVFGTTATATFLGSFLGPMSGGIVAAMVNVRAVFIVAGLFFLVNFVWVYFAVPAAVPARADAGRLAEPTILIEDDALVSSDSDAIVEIEPCTAASTVEAETAYGDRTPPYAR